MLCQGAGQITSQGEPGMMLGAGAFPRDFTEVTH